MKNRKIIDVLFREKMIIMLIELKKSRFDEYETTLAKKADCTFSHTINFFNKMKEAGIVNFEKEGRVKVIKLTKKGFELVKHIESIKNLLIM